MNLRRILSLFLTVLMVVSALPMNVLAEEIVVATIDETLVADIASEEEAVLEEIPELTIVAEEEIPADEATEEEVEIEVEPETEAQPEADAPAADGSAAAPEAEAETEMQTLSLADVATLLAAQEEEGDVVEVEMPKVEAAGDLKYDGDGIEVYDDGDGTYTLCLLEGSATDKELYDAFKAVMGEPAKANSLGARYFVFGDTTLEGTLSLGLVPISLTNGSSITVKKSTGYSGPWYNQQPTYGGDTTFTVKVYHAITATVTIPGDYPYNPESENNTVIAPRLTVAGNGLGTVGQTVSNSYTVDPNSAFSTTAVAEGWSLTVTYKDESGNVIADHNNKINKSGTIEAVWSINSYDIEWNMNGGTGAEGYVYPTSAVYGTEINPANPTREGHTFKGWKDENGNDVEKDAVKYRFYVPAKNTVLTAQWEKNTYAINFYDGEKPLGSVTKLYGENVEAIVAPEKTDFVFNGWTDAEGNVVTFPRTMPEGGMNVYADYTQHDIHIVTFDMGEVDGEGYTFSVDVTDGETLTVSEDGKTITKGSLSWTLVDAQDNELLFAGWDKPVATSYTGKGTTTYTAQWVADTNNNGVKDADETAEITVSKIGNGTVTLTAAAGADLKKNSDTSYTLLFNSKIADTKVVTVTATPADTINDDNNGHVDYVVSNPGTHTAVDGANTITVEFGARTIDAVASVSLNGHSSVKNDASIKKAILEAVFGAGTNVNAKVEVYTDGISIGSWNLGAGYKELGDTILTKEYLYNYVEVPGTENVKITLAKDGNLPEVTRSFNISVSEKRENVEISYGSTATVEIDTTADDSKVVVAVNVNTKANGAAATVKENSVSIASGQTLPAMGATAGVVYNVTVEETAEYLETTGTVTVSVYNNEFAVTTYTLVDGDNYDITRTDAGVVTVTPVGASTYIDSVSVTSKVGETVSNVNAEEGTYAGRVYTFNFIDNNKYDTAALVPAYTISAATGTRTLELREGQKVTFEDGQTKAAAISGIFNKVMPEGANIAIDDCNVKLYKGGVEVADDEKLVVGDYKIEVEWKATAKYPVATDEVDVELTVEKTDVEVTENSPATITVDGNVDLVALAADVKAKAVNAIVITDAERAGELTVNDVTVTAEQLPVQGETAQISVSYTIDDSDYYNGVTDGSIFVPVYGQVENAVVSIADGIANGTVTKTNVGDKYTVTATPDNLFFTKSVSVSEKVDGAVAANEDGTYILPNGAGKALGVVPTYTISAEFAASVVAKAAAGVVPMNGNKSAANQKDALEAGIIAALVESAVHTGACTVEVYDGGLGEGWHTLDYYTNYNIIASFKPTTNRNVRITWAANGVYPAAELTVNDVEFKESRQSLAITAADVTVSGKTEPADVETQVLDAITITATNPITDEVKSFSNEEKQAYISYKPAYAWPEDAQTAVFDVTVKVNNAANDTYSNAPSASLKLTCVDTTTLYTVTYMYGYEVEGDGKYAEFHVAENTATKLPENNPTRINYTFAGWNPAVAATVTGPATYTATWKPVNDDNNNGVADEEDVFTVKYVGEYEEDGETVVKTLAVFPGEDDEALKIGDNTPSYEPTAEQLPTGMKFSSWGTWYEKIAAVNAAEGTCVITYTAEWVSNGTFTVTFKDNGEEKSEQVEGGNTATDPNPTKEGYDFLGWYLTDAEGKLADAAFDFNTAISEDIVLTAKWREDKNDNDIEDAEEVHIDVVYVDGFGNELKKFEAVLVGLNTPAIDDPEVEGYIFNGWNPAVAETVVDFEVAEGEEKVITYTATWLSDTNGNDVEDALETITVVVDAPEGMEAAGSVTINEKAIENGAFVYDSTEAAAKEITVIAKPIVKNGVSETYVASIAKAAKPEDAQPIEELAIEGEESVPGALDLSYGDGFAATAETFIADGAETITVTFKKAAFDKKENAELTFYTGVETPVAKNLYEAAIEAPAYGDGEKVESVEYLARKAGEFTFDIPVLFSYTIPIINYEIKLGGNEITVPLTDDWLEVGEPFDYMTEEEIFATLDADVDAIKAEILNFDLSGINFSNYKDYLAKLEPITAKVTALTAKITSMAQQLGYHEFGQDYDFGENNKAIKDAEGNVLETLKIAYADEAKRIVDENVVIALKDNRIETTITGGDLTFDYADYTHADILAALKLNGNGGVIEKIYDSNGNASDAVIEVVVDMSGKDVGEYKYNAYFDGSYDCKPASASFTLTVEQAPASLDVVDSVISHGQTVPAPVITNKYGDQVSVDTIEFIVGLDVADLGLNENYDGIEGLTGTVQLIVPDSMQAIMDMIGLKQGATMSLKEAVEKFAGSSDLLDGWNIPLDVIPVFSDLLTQIHNVLGDSDVEVTIGGSYPSDMGVYLRGAATYDANYETAFDVGYLVIKPNAQQVYLDWNYNDTNGIFTWELIENIPDLFKATAYNDAAFTSANEEATGKIYNLFFGFDAKTGELYLALDPTEEMNNGVYTQLAFIAEFGNEMYYAVPAIRAFAIIPNVVEVEIVDEGVRTFNNQPQAADVNLAYQGNLIGEPSKANLTVTYTGIQTNAELYGIEKDITGIRDLATTAAPVHAGAYVVAAAYIEKDEAGNVIALGMDVQEMLIQPAQSSIAVIPDGNNVRLQNSLEKDEFGNPFLAVDSLIEAKSMAGEKLTPDYTTITASVNMAGGMKLENITGKVNIDMPNWLYKALFGVQDAAGLEVSVEDLMGKLNGLADNADAAAAELGLEIDLNKLVASLNEILGQLPEKVSLTFHNDYKVGEMGAYVIMGVVTDSDHYPSVDVDYLMIVPEIMTVEFMDDTGAANDDRIFEFDNTGKNMGVCVSDMDGNEVLRLKDAEADADGMTRSYVGVQTNGKLFTSTEEQPLPVHAGTYTAIAAYVEMENGVVSAAGFDTGLLVIAPTTAEITVDNDYKVYDGESVMKEDDLADEDALPLISVSSKVEDLTPDVTIISAALVTGVDDPEMDTVPLLDGSVNIDLPRWMDELMQKYAPEMIDGAAPIHVMNWLNGLLEDNGILAAFEQLGAEAYLQTLVQIVTDFADVNDFTFYDFNYEPATGDTDKDNPAVSPSQAGAYMITAVVTDSDHYPAVDTGLLIITPQLVDITFADENDNNLFLRAYNGDRQSVEIESVMLRTGSGEAVEAEKNEDGSYKHLTLTYTGIESVIDVNKDGKLQTPFYHSTVAPVETGSYLVTAIYHETDENGYVEAVGFEAGKLIIAPAAAEIAVNGGCFTEAVNVNNIVKTTPADGVEITVITTGISLNEEMLKAIAGAAANGELPAITDLYANAAYLNIDLPSWLRSTLSLAGVDLDQKIEVSVLKQQVEAIAKIYAEAKALAKKLANNEITDALLADETAQAVIETLKGADDNVEAVLAKLIAVLDQYTPSLWVSFDASYTMGVNGIYMVTAMVTDSDYLPAVDSDVVVISGQIADVEIQNAVVAYNDNAQAVKVLVNGEEEAIANGKLITYYAGVQTNGKPFVSSKANEAPVHAGAYSVFALYVNVEEAADGAMLKAIGADAGTLVILPAETAIDVDSAEDYADGETNGIVHYVYDGSEHVVNDLVHVETGISTEKPDTTVITAGVALDHDQAAAILTGIANGSIEMLKQIDTVNVDLPAWLDKLMAAAKFDGDVTVATMLDVLTGIQADYQDAKELAKAMSGNKIVAAAAAFAKMLAEKADVDVNAVLEAILKADDTVENTLTALTAELSKFEAGLKLTTLDQFAVSQVGAYLVTGVVTDSDYMPAADTGVVIITPAATIVDLQDENSNNQWLFTYDGEGKAVAAKVSVNGEEITGERLNNLVITYTGVQSVIDDPIYSSTAAPAETGAYVVTAVYYETTESGEIVAFGVDAGVMVIQPAEAEIYVENEKGFTGDKLFVNDLVHAADDVTTTVITAGISLDDSKLDLSSINGTVNIDVPAWLDNALVKYLDFDGDVSVATILKALEKLAASGYADELKLAAEKAFELGLVDTDISAIDLDAVLENLIALLKQMPQAARVEFKDNIALTETGAYVVIGLITDSDYLPAHDMGLVVIAPSIIEVNFVDETGAINNDRIFTFDGNAHAMPVALTRNGEKIDAAAAIANGSLKINYTGLQTDGKRYSEPTAPAFAGAYLVSAVYVEKDAEGKEILGIGAAAGAMVIEPAKLTVELDENIFEYDGEQHEPTAAITTSGEGKYKAVITAVKLNDTTVNVNIPEETVALIKQLIAAMDETYDYVTDEVLTEEMKAVIGGLALAAGFDADDLATLKKMVSAANQEISIQDYQNALNKLVRLLETYRDKAKEIVSAYGVEIVEKIGEIAGEEAAELVKVFGKEAAARLAAYSAAMIDVIEQAAAEIEAMGITTVLTNETNPTEVGAYPVIAVGYLNSDHYIGFAKGVMQIVDTDIEIIVKATDVVAFVDTVPVFGYTVTDADGNPLKDADGNEITTIEGLEIEYIITDSEGNVITDMSALKPGETYTIKPVVKNEAEGYEVVEAEEGTLKILEVTPSKYKHTVNHQVGLIEPWFLRVNLNIIDRTTNKNVDPSIFDDFGAYFIRREDLEDPTVSTKALTYKDIVGNSKSVAYDMGKEVDVTAPDNHATFVGESKGLPVLSTRYREGIYTYELSEDILFTFWYVDEDGLHFTGVAEKSVSDWVNQYKDDAESFPNALERDVFAKMAEMEVEILEFRAQYENPAVFPEQTMYTVGASNLGEPASDKLYKYNVNQQIILIEPWGMRLNAKITNGSGELAYNELDDYGIIIYNTADSSKPANAAAMLELKNSAYVFSMSNGNASHEADSEGYFTARYYDGIYTYQMDSNMYYCVYAVKDGVYYYSGVGGKNLIDLIDAWSVEENRPEKERDVLKAMSALYTSVTKYREDYFANK